MFPSEVSPVSIFPKRSNDEWSKNWAQILEDDYGIDYIAPEKLKQVVAQALQPVCYTTFCSKTKGHKNDEDVPKNFYVSERNLRFYKWAESENVRYGILSDAYGLHMDDEPMPYYDIHPSELNEEVFLQLGQMIVDKMKERGFETIVFINGGPLMCRPYFKMLHVASKAGIEVIYSTKFPPTTTQPTFGEYFS